MKINLDPWQEQVLDYEGDVLLCTGRRVGKTYILARKAIDYMAEHKNTPIVMVSLTEDQAMIIMTMALNYAKDTYPKMIGKGKKRPTMRNMWINGGRMIIRAVGNTGDAARGYEGGILIVDEASRMPKLFWLASKPILITTNGRIWMSSTLFGTENYFYKRFEEAYYKKDPHARFKVFVVTTEEVVEKREICESWTAEQRAGALRVLAEDKREMTTAQYAQEYLAIADINLKQYFADELIQARMTIERTSILCNIAKNNHRKRFLGVDIARHGSDDTVLFGFDRINNERLEQCILEILPKMRLDQQARHIRNLHLIAVFTNMYLDTTGMGWGVFDVLLSYPETKRKVVSIENQKKSISGRDDSQNRVMKQDLYENLLRLMQSGEVNFFNDGRIFQAFKSIQYEYTDTGKIKIWGNDSHIVEAAARGAWCMKDKSLILWAR